MEYKSTLNMSKSGFPMRAGLPKREPEMLKHWEELDLYNELLKKNEGKPLFNLHDGEKQTSAVPLLLPPPGGHSAPPSVGEG